MANEDDHDYWIDRLLYPDLLDYVERHGFEPRGSDRFKLWCVDSVYKRCPEGMHLRAVRVEWHHPRTFIPRSKTPWSVEIWHFHNRWEGDGKKRKMRSWIHVVKREFRDRAACLVFAERVAAAVRRVKCRLAADR